MKAALWHASFTPLTIEDIDIDKPQAQEVLIRTVASGVCGSDLHSMYRERSNARPERAIGGPAVMGHEAAGIVEAVGEDVSYVKPGDHVIVCLSTFCGRCERCLTGRPNLCMDQPARAAGDPPRLSQNGEPVVQMAGLGTHAEQMLVHEHSVVKIRDDVPFEAAALISCGVTTGVGAVFNTARVEAGSTVAVYGTGGVGLSVIQGARIAGARQIIAVDVLESKLATAKEMGATHVVDGSSRDAVEAIHDLTGGGVDYSFEAIGLPKTAEQAILSIRKGGTATLIGVQPDNEQVTIPTSWINSQREWKLQRSSMGSNRFRVDMPKYIDLYLQGRLRLDEMVTRKGKLEDINDFFRAVHEGEVSRTVITFDS